MLPGSFRAVVGAPQRLDMLLFMAGSEVLSVPHGVAAVSEPLLEAIQRWDMLLGSFRAVVEVPTEVGHVARQLLNCCLGRTQVGHVARQLPSQCRRACLSMLAMLGRGRQGTHGGQKHAGAGRGSWGRQELLLWSVISLRER